MGDAWFRLMRCDSGFYKRLTLELERWNSIAFSGNHIAAMTTIISMKLSSTLRTYTVKEKEGRSNFPFYKRWRREGGRGGGGALESPILQTIGGGGGGRR